LDSKEEEMPHGGYGYGNQDNLSDFRVLSDFIMFSDFSEVSDFREVSDLMLFLFFRYSVSTNLSISVTCRSQNFPIRNTSSKVNFSTRFIKKLKRLSLLPRSAATTDFGMNRNISIKECISPFSNIGLMIL
jgi:hypothetical protein